MVNIRVLPQPFGLAGVMIGGRDVAKFCMLIGGICPHQDRRISINPMDLSATRLINPWE